MHPNVRVAGWTVESGYLTRNIEVEPKLEIRVRLKRIGIPEPPLQVCDDPSGRLPSVITAILAGDMHRHRFSQSGSHVPSALEIDVLHPASAYSSREGKRRKEVSPRLVQDLGDGFRVLLLQPLEHFVTSASSSGKQPTTRSGSSFCSTNSSRFSRSSSNLRRIS